MNRPSLAAPRRAMQAVLVLATLGLPLVNAAAAPCPDADGDGYADCTIGCPACDRTGLTCGDCDDGNSAVRPLRSESCDFVDNNCDGDVDEGFGPATMERLRVTSGGGLFGRAVTALGDVGSVGSSAPDGFPDFAVGASTDSPDIDEVSIFSGRDGRRICCVDNRNTGPCLHYRGAASPPTAGLGSSLAGVGDLTGDGVPDIAAGARVYDPPTDAGGVWLVSGRDCSLTGRCTNDPSRKCAINGDCVAPGTCGPMAALDGAVSDQLGTSVAGIDLDGDGKQEVLAGAPLDDTAPVGSGNAGSVVVFSGAGRTTLCKLTDPQGEQGDRLGTSVAGIEDVDGDGVPDIAAGATFGDTLQANDAGSVVIFSGQSCLSAAGGESHAVIRRLTDDDGQTGDQFGFSIAALASRYLAIGAPTDGAPGHGQSAGSVALFSTCTGAKICKRTDPVGAGQDELGYSVAGMEDITGDGVPDIVAGSPFYGNHGRVLLFSCDDSLPLRALEDEPGAPAENLGYSVAVIGDVSRGGVSEVLAGAPAGGSAIVFAFERDCDGDGFFPLSDCDDTDLHSHPGAPEVRDGRDNQCSGDQGFGVVDEISGISGFTDPADKTEFSWDAQTGATVYEVARSRDAGFPAGAPQCTRATVSSIAPTCSRPCWNDALVPAPGATFFYLVRATLPGAPGSWGQGLDAAGTLPERFVSCPP